jgi:hypothetical protein
MPLFDPNDVGSYVNPIWIKMLVLPMEWWSSKGFIAVGDCLGLTLTIDEIYKSNTRHTMDRFLVNLKIKYGILEFVDLVCGSHKFSQYLDYRNVPFCCVWCNKLGHLLEKMGFERFRG